jgi:hypothetical protein|tara:strand:- start:191 stop:382 length:192 start_codon:yes stop_codon:yes gene_type:complete
MILPIKYILCGLAWMVFFEIIKDKTSPQVQLTNFDRFFGVLIWPLMVGTFVGALLYYFIKGKK